MTVASKARLAPNLSNVTIIIETMATLVVNNDKERFPVCHSCPSIAFLRERPCFLGPVYFATHCARTAWQTLRLTFRIKIQDANRIGWCFVTVKLAI